MCSLRIGTPVPSRAGILPPSPFLQIFRPLVEACVESLEQALAAEGVGADRIELCGPGEGGLTPSEELIDQVVTRVQVPVHVMIRPREGDFTYSSDERALMRRQIVSAREAGAHGVVFGVLSADNTLDAMQMHDLIHLARPMRVACHRAFDRTPDPAAALDSLVQLGVEIVLTSGHAPTAAEGAETLSRHVRRANGKIMVLAGGSVRAGNVRQLLATTGVREIHARATEPTTFAALVRSLD